MDANTAKAVKEDFSKWSGGFPPESDHQITVYVDYARSIENDAEDVREMLREWLCSDEDGPPVR
jgi:hypothetical protein